MVTQIHNIVTATVFTKNNRFFCTFLFIYETDEYTDILIGVIAGVGVFILILLIGCCGCAYFCRRMGYNEGLKQGQQGQFDHSAMYQQQQQQLQQQQQAQQQQAAMQMQPAQAAQPPVVYSPQQAAPAPAPQQPVYVSRPPPPREDPYSTRVSCFLFA